MEICSERSKLEAEHESAGKRVDEARRLLDLKIGVTSQSEFKALDNAADEVWKRAQAARLALDEHIREHGCEAFNVVTLPSTKSSPASR
jgi:hypothetical protein